MIKSASRWLTGLLLIGCSALTVAQVKTDETTVEQASEVELAYFVWSDEDRAGSKILVSRYAAGVWSAPQTVFSDNHLNILPAVAVSPSGALLAVWSAVNENGIKLKYSRGSPDANGQVTWSKQAVLAEQLVTNLAPVVIHDKHRAFWVFWSANDGADDDVYLSRSVASGWTPQARVHLGNSVPDALPEVGFNQNGNIWVRWDTFVDRKIEQQLEVFPVLENAPPIDNLQSATTDPDALRKDSEAQYALEPPPFFQSRSRATLYIVAETPYPVRLFSGNLLQ